MYEKQIKKLNRSCTYLDKKKIFSISNVSNFTYIVDHCKPTVTKFILEQFVEQDVSRVMVDFCQKAYDKYYEKFKDLFEKIFDKEVRNTDELKFVLSNFKLSDDQVERWYGRSLFILRNKRVILTEEQIIRFDVLNYQLSLVKLNIDYYKYMAYPLPEVTAYYKLQIL